MLGLTRGGRRVYVHPDPEPKWKFRITGHGERSASVARRVHRLLHRYSTDTQPGRLLAFLNQQFSDFAPAGTLATSLCAVYKSRRGEIHYAYGGQPRILFWQAQQRQWTTLAPSQESICGLPFGVTETACYDEDHILLDPGDILLMFSDGVPETRSASGELLQPEGVMELAQESTEEIGSSSCAPLTAVASIFLRRLEDFHGRPDFQDDITLLWIRRLPRQTSEAVSA